jgi:putative membrane protein
MSARMIDGGLAGLFATLPMSLLMEAAHRRLPWYQQYQLPPRQITDRLLRAMGIERAMNRPQETTATLAAHAGYGTAMGSLYGALSEVRPLRSTAGGVTFGLLVWAGSYLGVLPAIGLLPPVTRHPRERTALMIAAHLVWGAAMGGLFQAIHPAMRE